MRGVENTAKKHGPLTSILSPVPGGEEVFFLNEQYWCEPAEFKMIETAV